ncbi:MAG: NAD(P)H-quinone oxidoreductase [Flammeovirgaceae bacterium]
MKAILCKGIGGPEVMYMGEVAKPSVQAHQILVKVKATALNRADLAQRQGLYPPPKGESEIMGLEVAGVVEEVGSKVGDWEKGDRVFALLAGGGYAEYVVLDERLAMPIPAHLSFQEAAGIAEVFLTAYQAIVWLANLQQDETILIHAGASGVGTAAIQLAKKLGAKVIATVGSPAKISHCLSLGANLVINYKKEDFAARVKATTEGKGVDVIIDFIGASYYKQNIKSIGFDGRWVVLAMLGGRMLDGFDFGRLLMKRIKMMGSTLRAREIDYKSRLIDEFRERCLPSFSDGSLKPVIDQTFDWEEVAEAHRYMAANKNIGKIILTGM